MPILDKFLEEEPFLTPDTFLSKDPENLVRKQLLASKGIDTCILLFCSNQDLKARLQAKSEVFFELGTGSGHENVLVYDNKVLLFFAQIGGPQAVADIEELGYFGIKKFLCAGSCGLVTKQENDMLFLVEKAIRDEGASYHYLKPSLYVETDASLTEKLSAMLSLQHFAHKKVITWTTDAFYRESKSLIERRIQQGATTVEMECASYAAVCKRKGLSFAQILYSSDAHSEDGQWAWHIDKERKKTILEKLFDVCLLVATTKDEA